VVIDATYRYDGPAPKAGPAVVKIGLGTKVDIQPGADAANANANALKIRSQKSQGSYTFDNAAGHIVDSNLSDILEVGATMKVGLGPSAKEMELTQTTETTTLRKLLKVEKANPGN
jgi:hypothetical protein